MVDVQILSSLKLPLSDVFLSLSLSPLRRGGTASGVEIQYVLSCKCHNTLISHIAMSEMKYGEIQVMDLKASVRLLMFP